MHVVAGLEEIVDGVDVLGIEADLVVNDTAGLEQAGVIE